MLLSYANSLIKNGRVDKTVVLNILPRERVARGRMVVVGMVVLVVLASGYGQDAGMVSAYFLTLRRLSHLQIFIS